MVGKVGRCGIFALMGLASMALVAAPGASADKRKVTLEGGYVYEDLCGTEWDTFGLEGAEVVVKQGRKTIRRRFDDQGLAKFKVRGKPKKLRATVVLEDDVLAIKGYGDKKPYAFTRDVKLKGKHANEISLKGLEEAGAAHIWTVLTGAIGPTKDAMPSSRKLRDVTVRYSPGRGPSSSLPDLPGSATSYDTGSREILIDSRSHADQFEDDVLRHEFAHHVLFGIAHPGPNSAGKHFLDQSYPEMPAMAWSEGFAQAFGAIIQNHPIVKRDCEDAMDLGATPATPKSDRPWLNQYHEVSIAGALFGTARHLGAGDASEGLDELLGALAQFNDRYQGPFNTRQARDALIDHGLEPTVDSHLAITRQFSDQKIEWFFGIEGVEVDPRSDGSRALQELNLVLQGPYGACTVSNDVSSSYAFGVTPTGMAPGEPTFWSPGSIGAEGGLPFTNRDDCLARGGDGRSPYTSRAARIVLPFPYLADQAHAKSEFTLTATWICDDSAPHPENRCTSDRLHNFLLETGPDHAPFGVKINTTVSLGRNVATDLVRFSADGTCTWLPTGEDCRF